MSVWLCLCVSLSEHVQTPMLKCLRARESTSAAQFAGFFLAMFPASCPTSWTARPAEYATPPMLKRLRARETQRQRSLPDFLAIFPASCPTSWTTRPAEYAMPASHFDIAAYLPRFLARVFDPSERRLDLITSCLLDGLRLLL